MSAQLLVGGRHNRPYYESCPSVRPSVCPTGASNSTTKRRRKNELGGNVPTRVWGYRCANFQFSSVQFINSIQAV